MPNEAEVMNEILPTILLVAGVIVFLVILVIGFGIALKNFYRKVDQGKALIVNKWDKTIVSFSGAFVIPVLYRAEVMDISVKTIEIDRRGNDGLICQDNIRADIKVTFFVRVNKTEEDVLKVAQSIGCVRASAQETLEELFNAKFSEALKTVGKRMDFEDLYKERDSFKDQIVEVIGRDLNGYVLEDAAIDYLEQTPVSKLDPNNILDSQGIRKITELTATQKIRTNELENQEKKQIKKQDVEAQETILSLDRQQADAEARQEREINSIKAREEAEVAKVRAEEWQRSENAKIKAQEEIAINNENKQRQVEVAQKNRERVIGVETERVAKDRQLEAITREREVELQRIAKEKALEIERKEIQDVIRERVSVEKTVAEEEEQIKDLRVVAEAKRTKDATIIAAEAEAEEVMVKHVKEAEAQEQSSRFKAKERLTLADAELVAADKEAKAKTRLAEGNQAEYAAKGLAEARVKEVAAAAIEKQGFAEARTLNEKMKAEASGLEEQGLARARVQEAEAVAIEKKGKAEATAIQSKLTAEATGLGEKAEAMKALDGAGREHEEFRLRINTEKEIRIEGIHAQQEIARAQAEILREAFTTAQVHIVGGDGSFFEKFINAISLGKSIDGFVETSDSAKVLMKDYLSGEESLRQDVKEILTNSSLSPSDLQNLSVSALIGKLAANTGDESQKNKLTALMKHARELGIDGVKASS